MDVSPIDIETEHRGSWTVIHVHGELDPTTVPVLAGHVPDGDHRNVGLELSGVRFIDSSGLRELLRIRESSERLVLASPSGVVRRLLALTNLSKAFEVVASLDDIDDP